MLIENFLNGLLEKIAKKEGFLDYKIESEAGSNHGDNFLGVLVAVTISGTKGVNGARKPEKLHLLCKFPSANEMRKKNFKSSLIFNRELYVYSKVFPEFVKFQQEKGLSEADSFLSFPKVYACEIDEEDDKYILIMEDLRPKKFEMWPKEKPIALDHELLVLRELGKFHAISFAMKDQRPKQFEEFKEMKDTFTELCIHGKLKSFTNKSIERATNVLKNPEHKKLMEKFQTTYAKTIEEFLLGESSKEFGIVGHGDFWNNNILYQYADSDKKQVKAVSFIDFQITRYCPPVLDLLYNVFSSTDKKFRAQHFKKLMDEYYSSLSETIRKLGSDPNKLYTYEDFQSQLRKFGKFALLSGPFLIQVLVAGAKDVGNLDEYAETIEQGEEADLFNHFDEETQTVYSTLVNDLVSDLVDYGYVKLE